MCEFWNVFGAIVGAIGTLVVLYGLGTSIKRMLLSPKFVVGIIPSEYEKQNRGEELLNAFMLREPLAECSFRKCFLAQRVKKGKDIAKLKDTCSQAGHLVPYCREISLSSQHALDIEFVVRNAGRRYGNYRLAVTFDDEQIRLLDVKTESPLTVEALFTLPDRIEDQKLKELIPDESIRKAYQRLKLYGAYISFVWGSLEKKGYDIVHLRLEVPEDCQSFVTIFRIDHREISFKETLYYAQPVKIIRIKEKSYSA